MVRGHANELLPRQQTPAVVQTEPSRRPWPSHGTQGHELQHDQIPLPEGMNADAVQAVTAGAGGRARDAGNAHPLGVQFTVCPRTGALTSLRAGPAGAEVLSAPLIPCLFRAPTDNDRGGASGASHVARWKAAGLHALIPEPGSLRVWDGAEAAANPGEPGRARAVTVNYVLVPEPGSGSCQEAIQAVGVGEVGFATMRGAARPVRLSPLLHARGRTHFVPPPLASPRARRRRAERIGCLRRPARMSRRQVLAGLFPARPAAEPGSQ